MTRQTEIEKAVIGMVEPGREPCVFCHNVVARDEDHVDGCRSFQLPDVEAVCLAS